MGSRMGGKVTRSGCVVLANLCVVFFHVCFDSMRQCTFDKIQTINDNAMHFGDLRPRPQAMRSAGSSVLRQYLLPPKNFHTSFQTALETPSKHIHLLQPTHPPSPAQADMKQTMTL